MALPHRFTNKAHTVGNPDFLKRCLITASCFGLIISFSAQAEDASELEPAAIGALVKMSNYLNTLDTFQVQAETTDEAVLEDGQKVQTSGSTNLLANFPSQLRVELNSDSAHRLFLFDGKNFTLLAKRVNYYATVPAPATIGKLDDVLEEKYGFDIPMSDFFRWKNPDWKPENVLGAMDLGSAVIDGVTCQQFAFHQAEIDWQIWIQKGDFPLPRKLVITTLTDEARPQHTANYTWNLAPSFNDAAFVMDPDSDASRVLLAGFSPNDKSDK